MFLFGHHDLSTKCNNTCNKRISLYTALSLQSFSFCGNQLYFKKTSFASLSTLLIAFSVSCLPCVSLLLTSMPTLSSTCEKKQTGSYWSSGAEADFEGINIFHILIQQWLWTLHEMLISDSADSTEHIVTRHCWTNYEVTTSEVSFSLCSVKIIQERLSHIGVYWTTCTAVLMSLIDQHVRSD